MSRAASITILTGALAVLASSAAGAAGSTGPEPPSSLKPAKRGTVELSHRATRITACTAKPDAKKLTCSAEKSPADSSTTLTVRPVAGENLAGKETREPVSVSLPKEGGQISKLELEVGTWEVDWPGRSERDRFFVAENDEFAVRLSTQIGACKKQKDECVLSTDRTLLEVKIPDRCKR